MDLKLDLGDIVLDATLTAPAQPVGFVVFAEADRRSASDAIIAAFLNHRGFATLRLRLLAIEECGTDVELLTRRLIRAVDHIRATGLDRGHPIGLFAEGDVAAAALITAAQRIDTIGAIACLGGRVDLAGAWLGVLRTPTLFVVGSRDTSILCINRDAARSMVAPHQIAAISGATHLLEEPGALEEVAAIASAWFADRMREPGVAVTALAG
jgi:putative phosphoribosyl transferase